MNCFFGIHSTTVFFYRKYWKLYRVIKCFTKIFNCLNISCSRVHNMEYVLYIILYTLFHV